MESAIGVPKSFLTPIRKENGGLDSCRACIVNNKIITLLKFMLQVVIGLTHISAPYCQNLGNLFPKNYPFSSFSVLDLQKILPP